MSLSLLELIGPLNSSDAAIAYACILTKPPGGSDQELSRRLLDELLIQSGLSPQSVEADARSLIARVSQQRKKSQAATSAAYQAATKRRLRVRKARAERAVLSAQPCSES